MYIALYGYVHIYCMYYGIIGEPVGVARAGRASVCVRECNRVDLFYVLHFLYICVKDPLQTRWFISYDFILLIYCNVELEFIVLAGLVRKMYGDSMSTRWQQCPSYSRIKPFFF